MFDVAFSELSIIAIVAIVALGPKEAAMMIKNTKHHINNMRASLEKYIKYFIEENSDQKKESIDDNHQVVSYVIDIDGNVQQTYNLETLIPEIKKTKKKKIK